MSFNVFVQIPAAVAQAITANLIKLSLGWEPCQKKFSLSCRNMSCTRMLADLPLPGKGGTPSHCPCICSLPPRADAGALRKFVVRPTQRKITSKDLPQIHFLLSPSFDSILVSQALKYIWLAPEHLLPLPHWCMFFALSDNSSKFSLSS